MEPFTAASHDEVLLLVIQIAVLLFSARMLGELAQRFKQPSVIGEIMAGIILGPSLISSLFPALGVWIVPQTAVSGYLLEVVSLIGVMLLLLVTGLETDLGLIRRHARTAIGVSLGGITTTFATGFLLGQFLPDTLLADPDRRLIFALFVGTAMAISAIPVIAKIMFDMGLMRRDIGQTIIAAGMSDDTIGWVMLSIVAGLAAGEAMTTASVLASVGRVVAFMVLSFTLGNWLIKRLIHFTQDRLISTGRILTLVIVLTFTWGAISQALHLEPILGAFVVGILLGNLPRLNNDVRHTLENISISIFSPIFFAVAGLKVNLLQLFSSINLILIALLVIFVATFGKVLGTYLGARLIGRRDHWNALSFGAALNARGAMEIIIATIGLQLGILSQDMFSIIVLMAMATSLIAPFALRWTLMHVQPEKQELERLEREALLEQNFIAKIGRVLHPVRPRQSDLAHIQRIEAQVLNRLAQSNTLDLNLLTVAAKGQKTQGTAFLDSIASLFEVQTLNRKVIESERPADTILTEVKNDYDLLVLGASEQDSTSEMLFNPLVDYVTRLAPCPTMIVKAHSQLDDWHARRILVPSNGSQAARRAAELAIAIANGSELTFLNIVLSSSEVYPHNPAGQQWGKQLDSAYQIVHELEDIAKTYEVKAQAETRSASSVEKGILDYAQNKNIDLIILGTDLKPVSQRLFLGPSVEEILRNAPCPVIVLNTP